MKARFQLTTTGKWHIANRMVTWSITSCDLERSKVKVATTICVGPSLLSCPYQTQTVCNDPCPNPPLPFSSTPISFSTALYLISRPFLPPDPFPFHSLSPPPLTFSSSFPLFGAPLVQFMEFGERCKLPRGSAAKRFVVHLELKRALLVNDMTP